MCLLVVYKKDIKSSSAYYIKIMVLQIIYDSLNFNKKKAVSSCSKE